MAEIATAAEKALNALLVDYRNAHAQYLRARHEMFDWKVGAIALGAGAALFGLSTVFGFGDPVARSVVAWFLAVCIGVAVVRTSFLRVATRRLRQRLQHLKDRLDYVGYHVACDRSNIWEPLQLRPEPPSGKFVVLFDAADLDFSAYDRAFW